MQNNSFSHKLLWLPVLLGALLYLLCLPWMELRGSDEAVFAAVAREMLETRKFFTPAFQGQPAQIFPLYPWLVCLCSGFQTPGVLSVRLPAVLSVFGLALEAFLVARRHRDAQAGSLAAAIVLTTFGAMRVGIYGQAETLHAFLLSSAWFAWHGLGVLERRWRLAWGCALGLVFLDVLSTGLRGILLFYLPLLLTSMPPRTRRLLRSREHLECLCCLALGLYLWFTLVCPQPLTGWYALVGPLSSSAVPEGFFSHLLHFPLRCLRDLMPWSLFLWIPFCLALKPLEPAGSLCGFLRAVILTLFLLHWFMPGYSSLMMLPVLPGLAVVMSFNLPIVLHRWERGWGKLLRFLSWFSLGLLCYCALHWMWVGLGRITFQGAERGVELLGWSLSLFSLALGSWVWWQARRPTGEGLVWLTLGVRLAWIALVVLPNFLTMGDRQYAARKLLGQIPREEGPREGEAVRVPPGESLYLLPRQKAFPAQMFYTDRRVLRLRKGEAMPRKTLYVISEQQPLFPGWRWKKLAGPVDFQMHRKLEPSPLLPEGKMLLPNFPGRHYVRRELTPQEFPPHALEYYEPYWMNLYQGEPEPMDW